MASRTTAAKVKAVLGANYSARRCPDLAPFMDSAYTLTSSVVACAAAKGAPLTGEQAATIEMWLAGYFYTKMDPLYVSKGTDGASGSFNRNPKNDYLVAAIELDPSGCVSALTTPGQRAEVGWLGKTASERIPYQGRD